MASFAVPCPKCISTSRMGLKWKNLQGQAQKLSFQSGLGLKACQLFGSSSGLQCVNKKQIPVGKIQAKYNEATTAKSSSNSASVGPESGVDSSNENGKVSGPSPSLDPSAVSAFMTQVADLVKLVDSRDIVELELKQLDCEVVIRKKEALQPPPAAAVAPMPPSMPYYTPPPPPPPSAAAAPAPPSTLASPPPSKPAPALLSPPKASSSHPPLKCPMAGIFYRSPAPGEPAFVKVGDKVQKGQVVCIIEAMKLMNEIEADQSGTITEILVDDGKPVSVDTPLLVIVP